MRKNVLPITAGVVGALVLSVSASADFTGWQTEKKGSYDTANSNFGPDVGLVDVWNLYLLFDNPLDTLNAIFVIQDAAFSSMINSSDLKTAFDGLGGGFWNTVNDPPGNTPPPGWRRRPPVPPSLPLTQPACRVTKGVSPSHEVFDRSAGLRFSRAGSSSRRCARR